MIQRTTPGRGAALATRDLTKVYRLYRKPIHKFLDVFGLCPSGAYSEHRAVDSISLEIGRGEKVAIIGRNGAGKSTFLKMITETIRPTSGSIEINGEVSALLQIGTGFHPDFTGRQNVYAGFAHSGIAGSEADGLFDQVVDFAEIDGFIDQPMKTYSTGMAARLMFSAATALVPDILIVDEVLGVGDAYFSHKSFEYMRRMCEENDTTLLLVTHDLYSAMNLCDRFVWIDAGRVKRDGDGRTTLDLYEASIKEQEETRLRSRNQQALIDSGAVSTGLRVSVASRTGFALSSPLALGRIEVQYEDGNTAGFDVARGSDAWSLLPEGNLGPRTRVEGKPCRTLAPHGSIYHKVEWIVSLPRAAPVTGVLVNYHYAGVDRVDLQVRTIDDQLLLLSSLPTSEGWTTASYAFSSGEPCGQSEVTREVGTAVTGQYGTGEVRIVRAEFLDRDGKSIVRARHGEPLVVETELQVEPSLKNREVTFVIAFHRSGVATGAHTHTDRLALPPGDRVVIRSELDPLLLGGGEWMVTLGLGEADLYRQSFNPYFALNDRWYHLVNRGHTLQVESSTSIDRYSLFLQPARFRAETVEPRT